MAIREMSNSRDQNSRRTIETVDIEETLGLHGFVEDMYPSSHTLNHSLASRLLVQINRIFQRGHRRRRCKFSNCFRCTSSAIGDEDVPSSRDAPPTYSSICAGPILEDRHFSIFPTNDSTSIATRIPPPTYAQAQGIDIAASAMGPLISLSPSMENTWPRMPTAAICSRCAAFIITTVVIRRSRITHFIAIMLFLSGCWPCCVIPYCIDSCNKSDHYCPICRAYLGTYTPW